MYNGLKSVLKRLGSETVRIGNTQLGAAIVAAGSTSLLTYVFMKGSSEEENEKLRNKIEAMEVKIDRKDVELRYADKEIQRLMDSKIKSNARLATCQTQRSLYRYAHENSLCFWRQHYSAEVEESHASPERPEVASPTK